MQGKGHSIGLRAVLVIAALTALATATWAADHETVLRSFGSHADNGAGNPSTGMIFDSAGNLYGTTSGGGIHDGGMVFELSPRAGGGWTETVLHYFGGGRDGWYPYSDLIMDSAGNLYGATMYGGIYTTHCMGNGCGVVFELSPRQGGGWSEKVLHNFGNLEGPDGQAPGGSLVFDGNGNLYGTTYIGGIHTSCDNGVGCGTVFELSPREDGTWSESVLHSFGNGSDGTFPNGLIIDTAGNLYGTTSSGGIRDAGSVFELSPREGGGWTETVLHSFDGGTAGANPIAGLVFDSQGNLYGTTLAGGIHTGCVVQHCGTVFELSPREDGSWSAQVLHSFGGGSDGATPEGSLIFDTAGNLYGTTFAGGLHQAGTAFELSPRQGGGWTETILHSFDSVYGDGYSPDSDLILDSAGNLYGTTSAGGVHYQGTAFEMTP